MTPREQLLEALLVERFGQQSRSRNGTRYQSVTTIPSTYDDDELTTYARRKALDEACDGFDIPRGATAT